MNNTKSFFLVLSVLSFLILPAGGALLVNTEEPMFQTGQNTDKLIYRIGEPVNISFINNEPKILFLPEMPPWEIWKFDFKSFQWQSIFDPLALQVISPVLPGGMRIWTWDQRDNRSEQVPWGLYRADIPYSESLLEWELIISHSIFIIL